MFAIILGFWVCDLVNEFVCTVKIFLSEAYTDGESNFRVESGVPGPIGRRFGPSFVDDMT